MLFRSRSGTTIVEDDHHNGEEDYKSATQFSRTGTLDITIKPVSRLEMFYGLFSPEKMTRKIAEKAKVNGVDNYEYKVLGICLKSFIVSANTLCSLVVSLHT